MQTLLRLPQVKFRTNLSRSSIYNYVRSGAFPAPIQIGARAVAWLSSDIDAWIESRIKASRPDAKWEAGT